MNIGVIGLGLVGGSIFKKLSELNINVVGISRTVTGDRISNDYTLLKSCDIIFVCVPMNKTLEILDKLESYIPKETIVTDVCSLKEFVSKKNYKYKFIPSHPMAGTEFQGWEHSFADLFNNAVWAVTPQENTDIKDYELLKSVIVKLGAKPLVTSPAEHDSAVALISHAPLLIAQALCKNIENNKLAQELASSGFRDTTRLALSNTEMANDMMYMNNQNILNSISLLNKNINELLSDNYIAQAIEIKAFRQNLYENLS